MVLNNGVRDNFLGASMALVARKGVSVDKISATIKEALGRFFADWDISDLTQNLSVRNGVVTSTGALAAQREYENASVALINPYGESGKTFKQHHKQDSQSSDRQWLHAGTLGEGSPAHRHLQNDSGCDAREAGNNGVRDNFPPPSILRSTDVLSKH